jgi:hypothetical protein
MESNSQSDHLSLGKLWAKKYVQSLLSVAWETPTSHSEGQAQTAEKLLNTLRFASSQAWAKTEKLLVDEMKRSQINPKLIDPWQIADDSRLLFEKAAECYTAHLTPEQFSVVISPACGRIRQHYTASDPRILGFMSMQFHYTGQLLLEQLVPDEQEMVQEYLKVMDDHLYMPLQRSYEAAAEYDYYSPVLMAVRQLLPISTRLAVSICEEVAQQYSQHQCYSGSLHSSQVRISSIRDVEMFQIYLCLCALENSITAVQQELFPLCVMLYPPLKVHWQLVRQMLRLLERDMQNYLSPEYFNIFVAYLKLFQDMFATDVFPDDDSTWSSHPDSVRFLDTARSLLQDFHSQPGSLESNIE